MPTQEARLQALQQALGSACVRLQRIECFDISHTMGEATVASCVVYDDGGMKKSEYRRYNITGSSRATTTPRCARCSIGAIAKSWPAKGRLPDLILIDGGKGQVGGGARACWTNSGSDRVALVGVAKGEERKPGLEQLIVPDRDEPAASRARTIRACT